MDQNKQKQKSILLTISISIEGESRQYYPLGDELKIKAYTIFGLRLEIQLAVNFFFSTLFVSMDRFVFFISQGSDNKTYLICILIYAIFGGRRIVEKLEI